MTTSSSCKLRYKSLVDKAMTVDNGGWKLDLFLSIDEDYICPECQNICKNAVSLLCEFELEKDEHNDEDINLYCESCLKRVIVSNGGKCPISNHAKPKFAASRIPRKKIMKAIVLCPNSVAYQEKVSNELEGKDGDDSIQGCTAFKGTLAKLTEDHVHECMEQQFMQNNNKNNSNVNSMYLEMIEDLQQKNVQMNAELKKLKNTQKVDNIKLQKEMQGIRDENAQMHQKIDRIQKLQQMIQSDMKMNVESNENYIKNQTEYRSKMIEFVKQPMAQIPLSIHSFRKELDADHHPCNLLQSGGSSRYKSDRIRNFQKNENDWIVFQMEVDEQYCIPTQLSVRNHHNSSGVSRMKVFVGSVAKNEWHKLHSKSEIFVKNQSGLQEFQLDYASKQKKKCVWKNIKVEFVANNGESNRDDFKFCCCEIQLHAWKNIYELD